MVAEVTYYVMLFLLLGLFTIYLLRLGA